IPGAELITEPLRIDADGARFTDSIALQHLANHWGERVPLDPGLSAELEESLRVVVCANQEAEAKIAAREVLRHVRAGGRFREVAVIVRHLEGYHSILQRVFSRYHIPFFLDRRESV